MPSSLASVLMIANVRIHSPVVGSFQFSHRPPVPKWLPSFTAMACYFPCGRPSLAASRDVPAARRGPRMRLSRNGLAPSVRLVSHWNIARCAGECAAVQEIAEWLEKLGMSEYAEDARAPLPTNRV